MHRFRLAPDLTSTLYNTHPSHTSSLPLASHTASTFPHPLYTHESFRQDARPDILEGVIGMGGGATVPLTPARNP